MGYPRGNLGTPLIFGPPIHALISPARSGRLPPWPPRAPGLPGRVFCGAGALGR